MRIAEIPRAAAILLLTGIPEAALAETAEETAQRELKEIMGEHHLTDADLEKISQLKQMMAKAAAKSDANKTAPKKPTTGSPRESIPTKNAALSGGPSTGSAGGQPQPTASGKDGSLKSGTWQVLLRQDWQDIGILATPTPVDKATGASISYTNDGIAKNETWATHATGAIVYQRLNDEGPGQTTPFWETFASYATVNKLYNSNPKSGKNIDTLSGGGAVEFGYDDAKAESQNYFQFFGGAVQDNIKNTTAVSASAAWIPVSVPYKIHYPSALIGNLGYLFMPEMLAQYASTTDAKNVLAFSNRDQSLRLGPQLSLVLFPYVKDDSFWSNLSASVVYHWWYELYGSTEKHWLKAQLTYNLDKTSNFAITTSYLQGNTEDTGQATNVYMVSLTGKY